MNTQQIVAALIAERDRLTRAIEVLQGPAKRRGRPPKNAATTRVAPIVNGSAPPRKTRTFTAAQRKQQAERMKQYWAKKRKATKRSA